MARSKLLTPQISDSSWKDGRGAILTFIPEFDIKEFNLVYFTAGATRGNHSHSEFFELFLIADDSSGIFCFVDTETDEKVSWHCSKGDCILTPPNVAHGFYSLSGSTCISLLSKKWDDCNPPITHHHVTTEEIKKL